MRSRITLMRQESNLFKKKIQLRRRLNSSKTEHIYNLHFTRIKALLQILLEN